MPAFTALAGFAADGLLEGVETRAQGEVFLVLVLFLPLRLGFEPVGVLGLPVASEFDVAADIGDRVAEHGLEERIGQAVTYCLLVVRERAVRGEFGRLWCPGVRADLRQCAVGRRHPHFHLEGRSWLPTLNAHTVQ